MSFLLVESVKKRKFSSDGFFFYFGTKDNNSQLRM